MQLSEFDLSSLRNIVENKKGDWMSALLLQTIARVPEITQDRFALSFPEYVRAVRSLGDIHIDKTYSKKELDEHLEFLVCKCDPQHRHMFFKAFPELPLRASLRERLGYAPETIF